jgi:hypothetical protein
MNRDVGAWLVGVGGVVVLVGVLALMGALSWFGRLPGDIRFERGGTRVFVPLTSMLLVSAVLSVALTLLTLLRRR